MGDKTHFLTQKSSVKESLVNSDVIETACFNGRIPIIKRYLSLHGCRIIAIVEAFVVPLFFKVKQNRISFHLDLIKLLWFIILNMNEELQERMRDNWEILFSINVLQKS